MTREEYDAPGRQVANARKTQRQSKQFKAVCEWDMSRRGGTMARASSLAWRKRLTTLKSAGHGHCKELGHGREATTLRHAASTTDEAATNVFGHVFRRCVCTRGPCRRRQVLLSAGGCSGDVEGFVSPQIDVDAFGQGAASRTRIAGRPGPCGVCRRAGSCASVGCANMLYWFLTCCTCCICEMHVFLNLAC